MSRETERLIEEYISRLDPSSQLIVSGAIAMMERVMLEYGELGAIAFAYLAAKSNTALKDMELLNRRTITPDDLN